MKAVNYWYTTDTDKQYDLSKTEDTKDALWIYLLSSQKQAKWIYVAINQKCLPLDSGLDLTRKKQTGTFSIGNDLYLILCEGCMEVHICQN